MICQGCRVPHEGPTRCSEPLSCTCQHHEMLYRNITAEQVRVNELRLADAIAFGNPPYAVEVSPEEFDKLAGLANRDES